MSFAIWHRSEQELDKILCESPQLINQNNSFANTPLHLAVGWPYGIRALLEHGACVNATDQYGQTPLFYAIELGYPEAVGVLIKADCSFDFNLDRGLWGHENSFLEDVIHVFYNVSIRPRLQVPQEDRKKVLDTAISSLAERRRNLQSRLAALSTAVTVNPRVFQDDRILDEYARYGECVEEDAIRGSDYVPRHASSLLQNRRTVYHVDYLTVEVAEKFWQNGFRDIDVPDEQVLTPLMCSRVYSVPSTFYNLSNEIELSSWLIQKGAKLHRLQRGALDYNADPTLSPEGSRPVTSALHYVAYNIGHSARPFVGTESRGCAKRRLQIELHQLSKEARMFATTVFLDVSYDDCRCACSSQGCLASTMLFKYIRYWPNTPMVERTWFLVATSFLIELVGPSDPCPNWLVKEIIRYQTFKELELRHTCCERDDFDSVFTRRNPEEQAEIWDEDHEKIELLESLLQEFEEHRGNQDVLSFLEGYWARRMDQVHLERGHVDKEALREIGVVLYEVDGEWSDEEGGHKEGIDEKGSDEEGRDEEDRKRK